jgi:hypothetical protein
VGDAARSTRGLPGWMRGEHGCDRSIGIPSWRDRTLLRVQISKRTKFKFAEFATAFVVLRDIDRVFMAEDFERVANYSNLDSGQRRSLVAGYMANIDLSDPVQLGRLVRVYADAIDS